jgi:hypothetical protein
VVTAGTGVAVTGSGSSTDPFVISGDIGQVAVQDTSTIDLTLTGTGVASDPYVISGVAHVLLAQLGDVSTAGSATGYVLAQQASGSYAFVPPTTAPAGTISHDTSLAGDGSSGNQLKVVPDTELAVSATGVALSVTTRHLLVRQFADATGRGSMASPAPALNDLTSIQSLPGIVSWWDGSNWHPLNPVNMVTTAGSQLLAITGPYAIDGPVTVMTKNFSVTSDANGQFTVLTSTDLAAPVNGVLAVSVLPVSTSATEGVSIQLGTTANSITGRFFHGNGGAIWPSLTVTITAICWLY